MRKIYTLIAFCLLAGQFLFGQTNFSYTGSVQTWVVPATGNYKLEVWGAQGGNGSLLGGLGGYAVGTKSLTAGTTLYIYVGGMGNTDPGAGFVNVNGGYNGGGGIRRYNNVSSSGGGATDISTVGGEATLDGFFRYARTVASYNGRIIVGAGGGGQGNNNTANGDGGGLNGIGGADRSTGIKESALTNVMTGGYGTQTSGGNAELYPSPDYDTYAANSAPGSFGLGGTYYSMHSSNTAAGGGGGGYYGGGVNCHGDGGGGSSYIGGVSDGSTTAGVRTGNGYVTITPLVPVVTTAVPSSITNTSVTLGGEVVADNGNVCTEKGFYFGTTNPPTAADDKRSFYPAGLGSFSLSVTGLTPGTTYYVRGYGINTIGTGYGSVETFTMLKNSQTITFTDNLSTKTYGDAAFNLTGSASSGLTVSYASSNTSVATVSGSTVTIVGQGTSTITASQAGNATYSAATSVPVTLTVAKKALTVTGAVATNKVYDGNNVAAITGGTLVGKVGADVVTLATATSGTFAIANVGNAISVSHSMSITGAASGNYTLTPPVLSANITPKGLTVTGAVASNKVYDGGLTATISGASLVGVVGADLVALANATSGTFTSATVANGKTVTSSMTLTGGASSNYTLSQPVLTANITAKGLTVTGAVASDKIYDGEVTATITGAELVGVVGADDVTLATATSGTFASATVADGKTVTSAMTLTGAAKDNYTLAQPVLSANITAKELSVSAAVANNKVYDGNTDAVVSEAVLNGVVGADDVQLDALIGTFADKNVADAIAVEPGLTLKGAAKANYTLTQPAGLTANITAKELTVSGAVAGNKVYDGSTLAGIADAVLVGVVGEDDVQIDALLGSFESKNVADAIAVAAELTLKGIDVTNYTLTQPSGLSANITQKELTVTGAVAVNKDYDATTDALIADAVLVGVVELDDVMLDAQAGTFADKNVGTAIEVSPALTLKGVDAANYALTQPATLAADITAKELMFAGVVADKVYDGTTDAQFTSYEVNGVVGEEAVGVEVLSVSFEFTDVAVEANVLFEAALTGEDMGNYSLVLPEAISAAITPKELTVTNAAVVSKVYDGNADAVIDEALLNGKVGSDDVQLDVLTGTFADVNVASAINVTPALTLSGADKGNYSLTQPSGLKGSITKAALTVTALDAERKEGIDNPAFEFEYSGFVNSEDKSVIDTEPVALSAANASSAPGDYDITVSGGVDNNYSFTYVGATLTVTSTVGVLQNNVPKVKVYPNPFVSELNIQIENMSANARIKLYDMSGRQMMDTEFDGQALNLAHLQSGVYILKVEGQSFRIVKN